MMVRPRVDLNSTKDTISTWFNDGLTYKDISFRLHNEFNMQIVVTDNSVIRSNVERHNSCILVNRIS